MDNLTGRFDAYTDKLRHLILFVKRPWFTGERCHPRFQPKIGALTLSFSNWQPAGTAKVIDVPVVKQIAVPQIQTIEKIVEIPMVQAGWYSFNGGGKVIFIASTVIIIFSEFWAESFPRIARWWRKWWKFLKWDQLLRARCEKSTYRERPSEKRIPPKWCNRRSIDLLSSPSNVTLGFLRFNLPIPSSLPW